MNLTRILSLNLTEALTEDSETSVSVSKLEYHAVQDIELVF